MNFKIRNHLKIKEADIIVNSITCLAGPGMAGKSSLLGAITAVVTGNYNPYPGLLKKHIARLLHSGAPRGFVELEAEPDISARIDWPECEYSASAGHKLISSTCAGITSIVNLSQAERIKYITEVLKASPTDIDLISELKKAEIFPIDSTVGTEPNFIKLWDSIQVSGWDVTESIVKEKGTKFKGQWELITGEKRYGIRKADAYEPDNFTPDLKVVSQEALEKTRDQAKEWCDAANKDKAISDNEIANLQKSVDRLPRLEETLGIEQDKLHTYELARKCFNDDLKSTENRGLICPACRARLTLTNGELKTRPVGTNNNVDIKSLNKNNAANEKNIEHTLQFIGKINGQINLVRDHQKELANYKAPSEEPGSLDDASEKLAIAMDRLDCFNKYHDAHRLNNQIKINKKVANILAPDGLRLKSLKKQIDFLNNNLKKLCVVAGWDTVEFTNECDILSGGVPYGKPFLSRSERYRVKFLMQLIVAMAEKSNFIILDDVDTLMQTQRVQMLKIMTYNKFKDFKFVMGMAYDNNEDLPDFSKFVPGGKTYWVQEGKVYE